MPNCFAELVGSAAADGAVRRGGSGQLREPAAHAPEVRVALRTAHRLHVHCSHSARTIESLRFNAAARATRYEFEVEHASAQLRLEWRSAPYPLN